MLSNLALSALKERGYRALNSLSWFKVVYNRGDEGRVIVSFQDNFAHVELVKHEREGTWTSLWEGYIEEYYTPFAAQAAEQAFEACKRHRYSYGDDYKNDISTFVSGFLRDLLPAKTNIAKIYYRGGIGEAQDARDFIVNLPPDADTEDARRELLDVHEPWDGPWHDPLRDRGFERVKADSWYKQYPFQEGYLIILAEPHLNVPDEEGFDQTKPTLRLYCEVQQPTRRRRLPHPGLSTLGAPGGLPKGAGPD